MLLSERFFCCDGSLLGQDICATMIVFELKVLIAP